MICMSFSGKAFCHQHYAKPDSTLTTTPWHEVRVQIQKLEYLHIETLNTVI